jgi:formylglycine-generating enzyme required for sulfatase activity
LEDPDPEREGNQEQAYRLLRGGSWFDEPRYCRAAYRVTNHPVIVSINNGVRPCCLLPPGSLLGT